MDDKMVYDLEGGGWPCLLKVHFHIDSNWNNISTHDPWSFILMEVYGFGIGCEFS